MNWFECKIQRFEIKEAQLFYASWLEVQQEKALKSKELKAIKMYYEVYGK
jgi:hypothetical protein